MPSIIIPASKSLTITNKLPNGSINADTILVGNDGDYNYFSYLFFNLSNIPSNVLIKYAELILFKADNFYYDPSKVFGIYPCDYFSTYTTFSNHPKTDNFSTRYFYPIVSKVTVKVILTSLVSSWNIDYKKSTCIMLYGKNKDIIASFGSAVSKDPYLIPFLKIGYMPIPEKRSINNPQPVDNGIPSMEQVHVTGTVAANAKYNATIDIQVKRSVSNKTDNYYVVDQYDNLGNSTPTHIDKTYNIAIVPEASPADEKTLIFGGSYSE